jgi:hypothetical protein
VGLYDFGFRWYDAAYGRFVGVDPIAEEFPWVNGFNYAENEPVANVDLHGLQALDYSAKFQKGRGVYLNEHGVRVAKDIATIAGGALLIYGTSGAASPLVVGGGVFGGTYSIASGSAQLIADARGDFEKSDAIPETAAGFLAQPIDKALGKENRLVEKSADVVQNTALLLTTNSLAEGALNIQQLVDAGAGLINEVKENNMGNNGGSTSTGKINTANPFSEFTIRPAKASSRNDFGNIQSISKSSQEELEGIKDFIKRLPSRE